MYHPGIHTVPTKKVYELNSLQGIAQDNNLRKKIGDVERPAWKLKRGWFSLVFAQVSCKNVTFFKSRAFLMRYPFLLHAVFMVIGYSAVLADPGCLLKAPEKVSLERYYRLIAAEEADMRFGFCHEETGLRGVLSSLYKKGTTHVSFILSVQQEREEPLLSPIVFGATLEPAKAESLVQASNAPAGAEHNSMGQLYEPLRVEDGTPGSATIDEVAELIQESQVVFYTGAGISAGVVWTMPQLLAAARPEEFNQFLTISPDEKTQQALNAALARVQNAMEAFYTSCWYGEPTVAHYALTAICGRYEWGLLTENLDLLHEHAGSKPLKHSHRWLTNNISDDDMRAIDYVITIGLHTDESGFLAWYKAAHPEGTIIALNLVQPEYLDAEDLFVEGNALNLVPALERASKSVQRSLLF